MAFDFPSSPFVGQQFIPVAGGPVYAWNGVAWDALGGGGLAAAGSLVEIDRKVITSAVNAVNFTTGIGSTYDEYELHWYNLRCVTDDTYIAMRISQDGGATWKQGAGTYIRAGAYTPSTGAAGGFVQFAETSAQVSARLTNAATYGSHGVLRFHTPSNTSIRKTFFYNAHAPGPSVHAGWDGWAYYGGDTNAYNAIQLWMSAGNIAEGTFVLYGRSKVAGGGAVPPGSRVLIESKTISAPVATLAFTTGIDNTYDHYEVSIIGLVTSVNDQLCLRCSQDGGATWDTTSQYVYGYTLASVNSANSIYFGSGASATTYMQLGALMSGGAGAGVGSDAFIEFFQPWKVTETRKRFFVRMTGLSASLGDVAIYGGGAYLKAGAVNGIRFQGVTGGTTITAGTFKLYGIKK